MLRKQIRMAQAKTISLRKCSIGHHGQQSGLHHHVCNGIAIRSSGALEGAAGEAFFGQHKLHEGQWVDVDAPGSATSAVTMIDEDSD